MGHPLVSVRHALHPSKGSQGSGPYRFLATHLVPESSKLHEDILDEIFKSNMISTDEVWQMFFDRASRTNSKGRIITGVGVVFISPQNHVLSRVFLLTEHCSNNITEYNALIISLQLAYEMGIRYLEVYADSKLIDNQVKGEYEVRHEDLVPYHHAIIKMANSFDSVYISHLAFRTLRQML